MSNYPTSHQNHSWIIHYPVFLKIPGFFSSSHSRKIHHSWLKWFLESGWMLTTLPSRSPCQDRVGTHHTALQPTQQPGVKSDREAAGDLAIWEVFFALKIVGPSNGRVLNLYSRGRALKIAMAGSGYLGCYCMLWCGRKVILGKHYWPTLFYKHLNIFRAFFWG